jgi:PPK2 family polyphosphate:nucleotide phosphotransferase
MDLNRYKVKYNEDFSLSKITTTLSIKSATKKKVKKNLLKDTEAIARLQNILFAENRQSLLIILQGMDSAGKDGVIKHIMRGVNPQGVWVYSFKHPSVLELEHDYLWRHAQKLPERGQITLFNRSHYENVLISKVHPKIILSERIPNIERVDKIDTAFWNMRYEQINYFEKSIIQNGTQIIKLFLHLSKKEQRKRFLERIEHKEKHWKFSSADITERKYWNDYQSAYEQALKNTSTKIAPWYIIPADNKLGAHLLVSKLILKKLKAMNPCFPLEDKKEKILMQKAKQQLKNEQNK